MLVYYACILHLYTILVYYTCILCLYTTLVYYACILHLYTMLVYYTCIPCLYITMLHLYTMIVYYAFTLFNFVSDEKWGESLVWNCFSDHLTPHRGIDLTGSTVGVAFTQAMCSDRSSVGLTQDGGEAISSVGSIAVHELGHIFNMNHDESGCYFPPIKLRLFIPDLIFYKSAQMGFKAVCSQCNSKDCLSQNVV